LQEFSTGKGLIDDGGNHRNGAGADAANQRAQFSRGFSSTSLDEVQSESSSGKIVTMMQAAEPWHGDDLAICTRMDLCFTSRRCFLLQREMRSVPVIIADVIRHQSFQMPLIEHDDMVEQVSAAVADPALRNAVLP